MKLNEEQAMSIAKNAAENATTLLSTLGVVEVTDDESYTAASEILVDIAKEKKLLEERKAHILSPLKEAMRRWDDLFKDPMNVLKQAETKLKTAIASYKNEQRLKSQQHVLAAASEPDPKEVNQLMLFAAQSVPMAKGVSTYEILDFEVYDESLVPREFLCVDKVKIKAYIKQHRITSRIPGIRVFEKTVVAARTK